MQKEVEKQGVEPWTSCKHMGCEASTLPLSYIPDAENGKVAKRTHSAKCARRENCSSCVLQGLSDRSRGLRASREPNLATWAEKDALRRRGGETRAARIVRGALVVSLRLRLSTAPTCTRGGRLGASAQGRRQAEAPSCSCAQSSGRCCPFALSRVPFLALAAPEHAPKLEETTVHSQCRGNEL